MWCTTDRKDLANVLVAINRIADPRSPIPVLRHARLSVTAGVLAVTGTDLDTRLEIRLPCAADAADGEALVEARRLRDYVKSAAASRTTVEADASGVRIRAGASSVKWSAGAPLEDFPVLTVKPCGRATLPAGTFRRMLRTVKHAVGTESTRPELQGVLLHAPTSGFRAAATDGHRLALAEHPASNVTDLAGMPGMILPASAVKVLADLLPADDAVPLTIGWSSPSADMSAGRVSFDFGLVSLSTRPIDKQFPDYARVVPEHAGRSITAARKPLLEAVKRAALARERKDSAILLRVADGLFNLTAGTEDGAAVEPVPDAVIENIERLELGLNARYLSEALGAMSGSMARLSVHATAPESHAIRLDSPGEAGITHVIMPMRIQ